MLAKAQAVSEVPILFRGDMVRAILTVGEGGVPKTRTWRNLRKHDAWTWARHAELDDNGWPLFEDEYGDWHALPCHYGQPGGRLWVRETWRTAASLDDNSPSAMARKALDAGWALPWCPVEYDADGHRENWDAAMWGSSGKTRVSIHMPRWASRLALELASVRFRAPAEFTEQEAREEGFRCLADFHAALTSMHGSDALKRKGWALEFRRVEAPHAR